MSEEFDITEEFPIKINFDRVSKEKTFLSMTRLLALDLMNNPYLSIGSFVQSIPNGELEEFMHMVDKNEDKAMENVMIITEMLAQAEGLESEGIDELTERCNIMTTYITIESLKRKNFVDVYYENMSFGKEFSDKMIVQRKNV